MFRYLLKKLCEMLHLKLPTDPRWVNLAEKSIEEILIDHAFCEQKAATSCISLIVTYSYLKPIVDAITPVVREELGSLQSCATRNL